MKHSKKGILSLVLAFVFFLTPVMPGLQVSASADASPNPIPGRSPSTSSSTSEDGETIKGATSKVSYATMSKNIKTYSQTSKQVKAWLTVPNTNMDMPINLGGNDNYYYGARNWKGVNFPNNNYTNYVETATYLDYRTKIGSSWKNGSKHYVIYGHNWTNLRDPMDIGNNPRHTMFGQLPSYTDINFLKENPYIYFSTEENEGIWKVFSVAYIETEPTVDFNHNAPDPSSESFAKVIKEYQDRSMFTTDVDVKPTDKLLTLSTCTRRYADVFDGQRFVVVARLLRDGETDQDPITVSANTNAKAPKF